MKPVLAIAVVTAVQEDIILTAVAVEIAVQENLPFFKKSIEGSKHRTQWTSKCMRITKDYLESLLEVCLLIPFLLRKVQLPMAFKGPYLRPQPLLKREGVGGRPCVS